MAGQVFELTVKRPGEEDRVKPYYYPKAAHDGFDTAVLRKQRLASEIVLDELVNGERVEVRRWDRALKVTAPTTVIDFAGLSEADLDLIKTEHPTVVSHQEFTLTPAYENTVDDFVPVSSMQRAQAALKASGLLEGEPADTLPALVLPCSVDGTGDAVVASIIIAAYHRRYGRYPLILDGFSTETMPDSYKLVDLNKAAL